MRKIALIGVLALLIPLASIAGAFANPVWTTFGLYPWVNFKVTPSGLHIANDPLFYSSDVGSITFGDPSAASSMKGWVTFVCGSENPKNTPTGFEYTVEIKDVAKGAYTVKAYPLAGSSDFGSVVSYTLGTITVGSKGDGSVSGFIDLAGPAFYDWRISVELNGAPVIVSHPADSIDFLIDLAF